MRRDLSDPRAFGKCGGLHFNSDTIVHLYQCLVRSACQADRQDGVRVSSEHEYRGRRGGGAGDSRNFMKYRPEVDGLRAVAVIPVLFFHAGFEAFSGGFIGVDVFFVISGYLITSIIVHEIDTNTFSLKRFYERRARRILPALFLVCFSCIPFAWAWMSPPQFKNFSQSLAAVATFSSNVLFWRESGYFAPAVELKPLLHTWSLAVEEQFYLVFPLSLLLIRRVGNAMRLALVGAVCLCSFATAIYASTANPSLNFYLIPTRAWELGIGAALALIPASGRDFNAAVATIASLLGVALIGYAVASFDHDTPFPSHFTLIPVTGTALLIVFGGAGSAVGWVLRRRLLVGVGLISYSLYLWHQPIMAFMRLRSLYEPSATAMLLAILLALILAVVTWKFAETPFRRRNVIPTRVVVVLAVATSVFSVAAGIAGHVSDGFRSATPSRARAEALEHRLRENLGLGLRCENGFTLSEECRTSDEPEIVIWGDSFAMHLVDAVLASKPDAKVIQMTKAMCGPILGLAPLNATYPQEWSEGCLEFNAKVMDWIAAHRTIKYAILSSPFSQYANGTWAFYTDSGYVESDWQFAVRQLISTMDRLEQLGVKSVVVSPPPSFGHDIGRCLFKAKVQELSADSCDFPEAEYERHWARTIRFLEELDRHHRVIWLKDTMCESGRCMAAAGDTLLYMDSGHLSYEGSAYLGTRLGLYQQFVE